MYRPSQTVVGRQAMPAIVPYAVPVSMAARRLMSTSSSQGLGEGVRSRAEGSHTVDGGRAGTCVRRGDAPSSCALPERRMVGALAGESAATLRAGVAIAIAHGLLS